MSAASTAVWLAGMTAWLDGEDAALRAPASEGREALRSAIEAANFWYDATLKAKWVSQRSRSLLVRWSPIWGRRVREDGNAVRAHVTYAGACAAFLAQVNARPIDFGARQPRSRAAIAQLLTALNTYVTGLLQTAREQSVVRDSEAPPIVANKDSVSANEFNTYLIELST